MPRFSFPCLVKPRVVRLLSICILVCLCTALARAQSTLTVNTLADSNDGSCTNTTCSLRDAITQAISDDKNDTIQFSVTGTITLTSPLPAITQSMTIQGPGADVLTISGGHSTAVASVFSVGLLDFSAGTFIISGLTISDGIGTSVSLTVISGGTSSVVTFTVGGGLYAGAGNIIVSKCIFSDNAAESGGAIFMTSDLSVDKGGVVTETLGQLIIVDSIFTGNSAPGTPDNPTDGGAGGAVFAVGTLTINGSLFSGNSSAGDAGAIFAADQTSITNSTFVGNSANGPAGIDTGEGGAIFVENQGTVTNNTFVGNFANDTGGAIYFDGLNNPKHLIADNNIYEDNSAAGYAGEAIFIAAGTYNLDNSVYFKNNYHGFTDDCDGVRLNPSCGPGHAGNIEATSDPLTRLLANYGGATESFLPQSGSQAICAGSASLAINGLNAALTQDQRGFPLSSSYCANGGVDAGSVQSNYLTVNTLNDLSHSTTCTLGAGCSLRDAFGILASSGNADIDFSPSLVSVASPGVITLGSALPAIGGAANLLGPGANELSVSGGNSSTVGSVFTVNSGASALLSGLTITGGNAGISGGGINNSGTLTLLNSAVSANASPGAGGGIFNGGTLTMTDSTVSGNSAPHGAGIYDEGPAMTVMESTVFGNGNGSPGFLGGGIYVASGSSSVSLTNATVSGNIVKCDTSGGGCSFGDGGGVYIDSGTLTLANSIVAGNSANNGNADISGSYTDNGGNLLNNPTPQLSPLEYTGFDATLQTAIPLPGSPAICAGTTSNIPSGVTTDERGYPNTNSQYKLGVNPPCVDAGAVQSSYANFYWVQNPSNTGVNTPISPAPRVMVMEYDPLKSNTVKLSAESPVAGVPVTLTYSGGAGEIGGSLTAISGSDGATFNGLTPNTQGTGFKFSANFIPVFGSAAIVDLTGSSTFDVTAVSPPSISAAFNPSSIGLNGSTVLTITLTNPNASAQLTGVAFSDTASAGLTIPGGVANTCGQIVSSTPTQVFLSNVTLAAGSSCQVTIPLTPAVYGNFTDTTDPVTSNQAGNGNSASAALTVTAPAPAVTGISPASGPPLGGTAVTITGTSFNANSVQVNFGDTAATNVTVVNATKITATSPADTGTVDVTVITPSGTSGISPADQFAYVAPNFIVNTAADDSGGTAGDCPAGGSATACTLRDALAAASAAGMGKITFSPSVFNSPQTIVASNGTLNIPSVTAISGATTGSGNTLQNLVTISGGSPANGFSVFTVASGVVGASIANLTIADSGSEFAGGIDNAGALTVQNSTITGMHGDQAGAIYNNGGTLNISASTISGNHSGHYGGALYSTSGTVTVKGSTISGNAGTFGAGGILLTGGAVNVVGSTVAGNFGGLFGPGIYSTAGTLSVSNSIVSGNQQGTPASPGNYDDIDDKTGDTTFTTGNSGGNLIGYYNASSAAAPASAANLAPLGNYGGPTQTMVPLPGSAAICGGALANATAANIAADQRGLAFNPACPAGQSLVDSGAVQANYALAFTTEPPAFVVVGARFAPAPVVQLTEGGQLATTVNASIAMSDSNSALGGTPAASLASGSATFNNLQLNSATVADTLTATLTLNSALVPPAAISVAAAPTVNANVQSALTSPAPGSTLLGPSVTFTWTSASGATGYQFWLGTSGKGSNDLYSSGQVLSTGFTSATINKVPTNGATLYGRLYTDFNGVWAHTDYTFTAPSQAAITSPAPGSTLTGFTPTFTWSAGVGASGYQLWLGSAPGLTDFYSSGEVMSTSFLSATPQAIPMNGETVYARLYTDLDGTWVHTDSTFTAPTLVLAALVSPTPSSTLTNTSVTFNWSAGQGATGYQLWLGSTGVNSNDIYSSGEVFSTSFTSVTVPNIPTNAATIYVRLFTCFNGTWKSVNYTLTAGSQPGINSPAPGSTLAGPSVTFTWSPGLGATAYQLWLGSTGKASNNLYSSGTVTGTSVTVLNLPTNGETINARLYILINGVWSHLDYTYAAHSAPVP